jgi:hypothetical protein
MCKVKPERVGFTQPWIFLPKTPDTRRAHQLGVTGIKVKIVSRHFIKCNGHYVF